jgi:hypothetical protein
MTSIDLIETAIPIIKKIKVKELKALIKEQKLFKFDSKIRKKDLIEKLIEHRKLYEDDSDDDVMIEEITDDIRNMNIEEPGSVIVKYNDPDIKKNYVLFKNNILYEVCVILKDLVEECRITFTKEGFYIKMIDKSLVCLLDISIKNCYERSNLLDGEKVVVMNLKSLMNILDCKERDQQIKIIFGEDNMLIHFYQNISNCDKFKIHLLDENLIDPMQDFHMEFNHNYVINSKQFSNICSKIKKFDDKFRIKFSLENNKNVRFISKNELIQLNANIQNNQLVSVDIDEDLEVLLLLKYIHIFCKSDKFSKNLIVNLIDGNHPIEMKYILDKLEDSYVKFVISPQNNDVDY